MQVLTFIIYTIMSFHHEIVLNQYIVNYAVLQRNNSPQNSEPDESKTTLTLDKQQYSTKPFGYFELLKMKYVCCGTQKSQRIKQYKQL